MQQCKIEGCLQPIASRKTGLCHKHHLRFIRSGTTELRREFVDTTEKCIVDGCNNRRRTVKGFCLKHYKEWKRKQPADPTKKCVVCGEPIGCAGCNGMCCKHYAAWLRYGDPLHSDERKYKPYGNPGTKYYKINGKFLHRVIAEEILGRPLRKDEVVHHINLNKLDNRKDNIFVCSNKEHLRLHRQLERVAASLIEDGFIVFEDGNYKENLGQ